MRVLTPDEHKKVLEAAKNIQNGFVVILALATGMRLGECVAVQWSDINFNNASITISRNLNRLKNYDDNILKKTVLVTGSPKTKNSQRVIPLTHEIIDGLKVIQLSQQKEKKLYGAGYNDKGYIFASPLGVCIEPRTMQDVFKRVIYAAQITDANFHALRHTFATRALEAGIPAKVVSEILGHASVSTTLDLYSHVLLDTKRDAINKINEFMKN